MVEVEMESTSCEENEVKPQKLNETRSNVLNCFTKLIADDQKARLNGGINLLKHLSFQKNEDPHSKELDYSLRRLIRGLGSSKAVSRTGFYMTLTAFLKLNPDTQINDLLQFMDAELRPNNSNAKSENADIHLGRVLLCGAVIRSQLLVNSQVEDQQKIIEILLKSGAERSYLSYSSTTFIIEFLNQFDDPKLLKASVWPILKKELGKSWADQTLDTFYLIMIMSDKFPTLVGKKFFKEHFGSENIIEAENIDHLLKLLTDIPRIHYSRHPLYKMLCEKLVATDYVVQLWTGIDQRFTKPSRTMEYLALEILNFIVPQIKDKSIISSLLSPNFLHYMLKRFTGSHKNREDAIAVSFRTFFTQIVTALNDKEISSKITISVIKKLVLHPGDLMIEKITGTKIIQMITMNMSTSGIKKLSKFYCEIISNSNPKMVREKEEPWMNAERLYAGQLVTKLLGHSAVNSEHTWRLEQLKFLFDLGFCQVDNVGVELASQFRDMFYRALDHKLPKLDDLRNVLTELVEYLNDEVFEKKTKILRKPLEEGSIEAWNKMISFIKKPEKDFKSKHAVLIFFTMDLNMGLQLFTDAEMAISSINEIHSCAERLLTKKSSKKQKKQKVGETEDEEPEWVEVIVDLLLSLLSRNSHLLRSLGKCVFPHMCSELTSTSIHQILAVLDPKDDKGPLGPKNSENDEESDEESDIDSENENSEDEEKEDDDQTEYDESTDDDIDDDDDDEEEDETVTDRLRLAVRQALGDASAQTDDEDIDIDQIDDEQGKRLDESLAAAFRILRENRQSQKKKQKKSAEALTHFRVRVMDLLEIYLDSTPSMALAMDILVPLFALLEFCIKDPHQKPLENRVRTCLKKLSSVKKFKDSEGVNETLVTDLAKLLVQKGERSTSICQEMGDKLAECCTFLIRCVQQSGLPSTTLVDMYRENLTAFFNKRDCIIPAILFKNALQLDWDGNWQLVPLLVDYAFDNSIRSFRRGQALEFLTIFYRNQRMINTEEHKDLRKNLEKKLFNNCINLFKELNESKVTQVNGDDKSQNENVGKEPKQKFICLLWILLKAIYSHHIPKAWNWKNIADAMVEYRRKNSLSKDTKCAYNRLAKLVGAPKNVTTEKKVIKVEKAEINSNGVKDSENNEKNNSDESSSEKEQENDEIEKNGEDEASNKKSKKEIKKKLKNKSKQKDKQKLKKEARELRAKAMSEGLEDVHFSSVQLPNGSSELEAMEIENGNVEENLEKEAVTPTKVDSKKRGLAEGLENTPNKSKKKKNAHAGQ